MLVTQPKINCYKASAPFRNVLHIHRKLCGKNVTNTLLYHVYINICLDI